MPAITPLANTPSPSPATPASSDFPALQPGLNDVGASNAFLVGTCDSGAIVTVTPIDAAATELIRYAADGGVAVITVAGRSGQSYLLRAWSSGGIYLGEYRGTG